MAQQPRIADVQCSRLQFQPGDKILVKLRQRIDSEARKKLQKTVERWAGSGIEVLIIDLALMDIEIEHGNRTLGSLVT